MHIMDLKKFIKKVRSNLPVLRYLPQTLWFNFHYLPWRQAVRLPILLYKPRFVDVKGTVKICCSGGKMWNG